MDTFEITLQHSREGRWPVTAEYRKGTDLPRRVDAELLLPTDWQERLLALALDCLGYGSLLGKALFQDAVRDLFVPARQAAMDDRSRGPLHVLLVVEDTGLRRLRWECLVAPAGPGAWDFLALNPLTPYSRDLPSPKEQHYPDIGSRDLRALVVLADPPKGNLNGLATFNAGTADSIQRALGAINADFLGPYPAYKKPASRHTLIQHLASHRYTVLHLVAHGVLHGDSETVIYLLDAKGQVEWTTATALIDELKRITFLPYLVVLATCESAAPEAEEFLGGLAQRLVRDLGIPCVLAMTDRVSIQTVESLTAHFYHNLAQTGQPDLALAQAMVALLDRPDRLVPALFGRLGGRPLFSDALDNPRDLTNAEIAHGLTQFATLLPKRAPILQGTLDASYKILTQPPQDGPTPQDDPKALSPAARTERKTALDAIDALAQEVLDISFRALALGHRVPTWDGRCPFPGLRAFQTQERDFFFGREALRDDLLEKLRHDRFLAVLGTSGSGKSSLVFAGLVPVFIEGADPMDAASSVRCCTPGADPAGVLDSKLDGLPVDRDTLLIVDQFEELFTLCRDPDRRKAFVERLIGAWTEHPRLHVLITLRADFWGDCADHPRLKNLMQANQELIAPMSIPELRAAMEQQAAAVGLRFEADLAHSILAEVEQEPGVMPLLQHLLLELWKRRHGRWLRASEYRALGGINQAIAHTANGIFSEFNASPEAQKTIKAIFIRLTRLDDSDAAPDARRDTRHRVALRDLIPAGADEVRVRDLVRRLADARLVVTSAPVAPKGRSHDGGTSGPGPDANSPAPSPGEPWVEVSHEALIRHWPRLRGWLDESRADWILLAAVSQQAADWHDAGEHNADLPRWGGRMQRAQALYAEGRILPTAEEQGFIQRARKLAMRRRQAIGAFALASCAAIGYFLWAAWKSEQIALFQAGSASWIAATNQRSEHPLKAAHLFARAATSFGAAKKSKDAANARMALDFSTGGVRLHCQTFIDGNIIAVNVSPDRSRVLTISESDSSATADEQKRVAHIWDIRTCEQIPNSFAPQGTLDGALFSPEGSHIGPWAQGSGGGTGVAQVSNSQTEEITASLNFDESVNTVTYTWESQEFTLSHDDPVIGVTLSPDKQKILTWGGNQEVAGRLGGGFARLWDVRNGESLAPPLEHDGAVIAAQFSGDGAEVLTHSDDGSTRLWNSETGDALTMPLPGNIRGWQRMSPEFDPTGRMVFRMTGNVLEVWDISGVHRVREFGVGHVLQGVSFTADASWMLAWVDDAEIGIWDTDTGRRDLLPTQGLKNITGAVISSSASHAVAWNRQGKFRVWNRTLGNSTDHVLRHEYPVLGATLSRDGERILTWCGSDDSAETSGGYAKLWETATGLPIVGPLEHEAAVNGATFDIDESRILTWGDNVNVRLWDATKYGPVLRTFEAGAPDGSEALRVTVSLARFSPDGTHIVASTEWTDFASVLSFWDADNGTLATEFQPEGGVWDVHVSVDNRRLLVAFGDEYSEKGVRIYNRENDEPETPLMSEGEDRHTEFISFNKDESRILSVQTTDYGTTGVQIWDTRTSSPLTPLVRTRAEIMGARFYADDAGVMLWRRDGIVGRLDLGVDTQWPVEQLTLRLEVESGTALNTVGEVIFLPVADWQRKRYCDYDAIRYDLGRLKDGEWAESQRRCQSLDEAVADASPELKAGATRTLKGGTQ